jgi:outer membrane protein
VAAALSLLSFALPLRAQTLQELYDTARGYDAAYLSARSLTESAIYRAAQADALMRPNVALTGAATGSRTKLPAFDAARGGSTVNLAMNGRQPLFNRANNATIDQAYKSLELSQYDLMAAEQDLILRLAQAYFDVLGAQDTLATTRASKTAIAEQLASAKRNFEVGTATITDTREAQARFDLATAQEIAADNDLRTKRVALDQLVGLANVVPRPLAVPVALPPVEPPSLEEWVARADAEHPNVQRARLTLDIASIEIAKARAGHLPTVDAVAQLANTQNNGGASTFSGATRSASLGLQLNVPIFSGFSVQNLVREKLLLEDKAKSDLDAARRGVAQATRQFFYTVQSGQAQVKALEAAESSSQLALEATQLGYRVGVRVNVDVLNAQSQLYTTRRDLARARYDVLLGGLRLRQASGRLVPEDVAALNQVLVR